MLCTCKVAVHGWDKGGAVGMVLGAEQVGAGAWTGALRSLSSSAFSAKHADLLHYTTSCVQRFDSACERCCGVRYKHACKRLAARLHYPPSLRAHPL